MSTSIQWGALEMIAVAVLAAATPAVALAVLLRRRAPPDDEDAAPPLERAKAAAASLTPVERERLRRWLDEQWPRPPGRGEGIRR